MGVCLLVGPPTLSLGGVLFEDHPYCGPMPVTKTGIVRALPDSHPFWLWVSEWYRDGKPLDANGQPCAAPKEPSRG